MIRTSALALAAAALLAGCGGGDDEDEPAAGGGETTAATTTEASEANTLEAASVGFTFSYPKEWQEDEASDEVLAVVTPTPGDEKNGIKVRETAPQELEFAAYSPQISAQFEEQLGTKVDVRTETIGEIDFGIMEWSNTATFKDLGQETTTEIHSTSYFFKAGGKTWQVECISAEEHRDDVDTACEQAVGSIQPE